MQQTADRIYRGGTILTMNDAQPQVEALAVQGERILAVGSWEELQGLVGESTEVVDLKGRTLMPGFIDAHGHLMGWILYWGTPNLAPPPAGPIQKISDILDALGKYIADKKIPQGTLVLASGYDDSLLEEKRHPTKEELNQVSEQHLICIVHTSAHLAVYNTPLLKAVGYVDKDSAPEGGAIRVDGKGEPTGVVEETAVEAFHKLLPKPNLEELLKTLTEVQQRYASLGITTVEDGISDTDSIKLLQYAASEQVLFLDVLAFPKWTFAEEIDALPGLPRKEYVGHFKVGGVKITQDGSPQGKTAFLREPYIVPPTGKDATYQGAPIMSQQKLNDEVDKAFNRGWQLHIHCNGDAAADMMLEAIARANQNFPSADRRPVMVHAQTVREDQLDRMKELGIIPTYFVSHTFYWGDWHRDETLGEWRAKRISPLRSTTERGMIYTIHNDSPVVPPDILPLVWSAVARTTRSGQVLGPKQCATPLEALKAVTAWAAYQNFEEKEKGTLEPGKLADLVVLSDNPLTVSTDVLRGLYVWETIKGGTTIYHRQKEMRAPALRRLASSTKPLALSSFRPQHRCC
ncbi:putative metal-dependent hydrolase with the TIM-barrel fold protein [Hyalangium minutum]|uniref:Putative metal-dependent hydrolase with the TIM-barrel fold protein n=2 Tax=Hyalangium minutum TaxID=394096 RepID=A0A085W9L3_9BACT|nr:putative metal-dependent hydrolase with the TIM-barrel fold protein [Hyalangium minutum]